MIPLGKECLCLCHPQLSSQNGDNKDVFMKGTENFLKRSLLIIITCLGLSSPSLFLSRAALAQYYYGYVPGYTGCLTGCGVANTAVAAISIGLAAVDTALQIHAHSKANQAIIQQYQYQAEINKAIANYPQRMVDYYNILRVAPFFDDDIPKYPTGQNLPQIKSFSKKGAQEISR